MADLITMPKLGFDMAEGTLVEWTKKVGDAVAEGDVIAMIETDKANVEVTSFKAGVIRQLLVEAGTAVPVNTPIAIIGAADEPIDSGCARRQAGRAGGQTGKSGGPGQSRTRAAAMRRLPSRPGQSSPRPSRGAWPTNWGLICIKWQAAGRKAASSSATSKSTSRQRAQAPQKVAAPPPIPTPSFAPPGEGYRAEPLTPMRQTIARRMTESKQQAPHFYITMDVDMAAALDLRKQLNALLPETESISVNDLLIKAAAIALKQFPHINASFAGSEIRIHDRINIGIAVSREVGLVTTVLQDADKKPLAQIARESREIIARAREGRMRAEEMVGGTLNISNLGMYGVEDFIAIISPPQAAVLAIGAIQRVPVVDEAGQLAVGTRMKVTISADHRVTDGAEAARFLQAFKAALEQPMRLVL